jgi:POT family proton-dependent oligopeptide transporter
MEQGLSIGKKFIFAIIFMTAAYAMISLVSTFVGRTELLSPLFIIPAFLMISLGEILLSPVGLSAITLLADKNKVSTMMGIFFVSLGIGGFLAGKLAGLTAIPTGETNITVLRSLYAAAFNQQLNILFAATIGCLVIYAVIKFLLTRVTVVE